MNGQGKSLKGKEFIHDKNFAPKQNERDCPMTDVVSQGKPDYPVLGQNFYPVKILEKSKSGKETHPKVR